MRVLWEREELGRSPIWERGLSWGRVWYLVKVLHKRHNLFAGTETLSFSVYEPIAIRILCGGGVSAPIWERGLSYGIGFGTSSSSPADKLHDRAHGVPLSPGLSTAYLSRSCIPVASLARRQELRSASHGDLYTPPTRTARFGQAASVSRPTM